MIEHLYQEFSKELLAWCRNMTGKGELAEDLVQEGYVRAMNHEDVLANLNQRQQRAWLYRTIRNLYVDYVRHGAFETTAETLPETAHETGEYTEIDCFQMLNILPDEDRLLFVMRYLEGYTSAEIGNLFQLPDSTVRSRLALARKRLRKIWSE